MRRLFAASLWSTLFALPAVAHAADQAETARKVAAPKEAAGEATQEDPFLWLEDVHGERALAWVKAQNARTLKVLEGDPRFEPFRAQALALLTATDRIPAPDFRAGGVDNFWQDQQNPRGLWRHTTLESYASPTPTWKTVLDVDALGKLEGKSWVFKGESCLPPADTRCLVRLSNGGQDAVEVRELDVAAGAFVPDGLRLPEGKGDVEWEDADTLIAGREWGGNGAPSTLTESGYPFVLKRVRRGQPFEKAEEVFRGKPTDVSASATALRDAEGALQAMLVQRGVTFFESEFYLLGGAGNVRIPLPPKATLQAFVDGQLVFTLEQDWGAFRQGALVALSLADLKRDAAHAKAQLVLQPTARQAIEAVSATRAHLVVNLYEDVKGAIDVYAHAGGRWTRRRLALPKDAPLSISIVATSHAHEQLFVESQGFLAPTALWLADAGTGSVKQVKSLPARFDASTHRVQQLWTKSKDGTRIPYFLVAPRSLKKGQPVPTLVYGYGGFQVAKPPVYLPEVGKLWLERGNAYVIANIRGGGEFGPRWHQAVLRENRQKAFDDYAAVLQDLVRRGVSSPRRLGIYGRSNGGVLTSVTLTQHPELLNAAVIESPLIDMLRYHKLPAGASWVGEYGNPDVPADAAFIAKYSAYQHLQPGVKYPRAYITTNTRDDRVHPGHARKFAAKLEALGAPYLYFENTEGGHSNDSDPVLNARRWALHYVYLMQQLVD
ncbi:S9 family peptidase [Aggregicoccus sp. 17bor-14]|uniref:prolyl oligopeptidase family serine peptidase n=1 Tax=Myxococcaceae TaxID=31 RepID=UPI00129C8EB3|nr:MULTISPECIES: prolyl oligopeptidase family serine peptidase [Myxococcaceae]MBF5042972.1 S9 family peptidase [Simulacricoccus sp. 17bor-14]MRI88738.1 S9 family peptidase [Aggregicoccus sp. 17bor-14]